MNQHTKGPWRVTRKGRGIPDERWNFVIKSGTRWIAEVNLYAGNPSFVPGKTVEGAANARLIAAAPELLEELKSVTEKYLAGTLILEDFDAVKAVIAKATEVRS